MFTLPLLSKKFKIPPFLWCIWKYAVYGYNIVFCNIATFPYANEARQADREMLLNKDQATDYTEKVK